MKNRHEAFFLEQAVLHETRHKWSAPQELVDRNWGGLSELREMKFNELEK